jgi:hypothetical protein
MANQNCIDDEYEYIFVTSFFHKGLGRRIYASSYGKTAFRLRVKKAKATN